MFTGIITAVGQITDVRPLGPESDHGKRLALQAPAGYLADAQPGDSIAINGACMTVATLDRTADCFEVDVSRESLACTTGLSALGLVNLEQALRAQDRLGGHLVTGHVDGIGRVTQFTPVGESHALRIEVPEALMRYLAVKGSITVNGVSLTVNQVHDRETTDGTSEVLINLIPHTLAHTTLGHLQAGAAVNLEIDLIARYVERMLGMAQTPTT